MNKHEVLLEIFKLESITDKVKLCPKISFDSLLEALSKDSYNLKEELGISAATLSRYLSKLFPDRPTTTSKVCNYLLLKYGYKQCKHCTHVKECSEFYKNSTCKDGLSTYCKSCQAKLEKPTAAVRTAKYRAAKLDRLPSWVPDTELVEINEFYKNCPVGYQVDHIIPLQGDLVSGLHVLANLQYLLISENASKKNKFTPS